MENGKAYNPSGVVTEMLKVSSDKCSELIGDLTNSIVWENTMPSERDEFIFSVVNAKWTGWVYFQCSER